MNRLAVLGLSDVADFLYRQVLREQGRPASVYAARLNVPVAEVDAAAESLRSHRLVRITERGDIQADHPRASLERILSIEEAQLATRRRDLARLRDAIDGYAGDHRAGQEHQGPHIGARETVDAEGLVAVMEHLAASTSGPVRTTHIGGLAHSPAEHPVLKGLAEQGRDMYGIYEFDGVQMRTLELGQWATLGEQQRLTGTIPNEFVCYGTDAVLASTDWGSGEGRYAVLRDPLVVRAFVELFDRMWASAAAAHDEVDTASERLVELMQAGLKDESIARVLGISLRTVRRRIAALMEECDVDTRFQLAVALTERGVVGNQTEGGAPGE